MFSTQLTCKIIITEFLIGFGACALANVPAETFAKLPNASNLKLSPNGKHLLLTATVNGEPKIVVRSMEGDRPFLSVLDPGKYYIDDYNWANNERILIWVRSTARVLDGQLWNYSRIISIGINKENPFAIKMKPNSEGFFRQYPRVVSWIEKDKDHVLLELDDKQDSWAMPEVHKVNIATGQRTRVQRNIRGIQRWIADQDGNIRVGRKIDLNNETQETIYVKHADGKWEVMQKSDYFNEERIKPIKFDDEDSNILLVESTDQDNSDKVNVYKYDMTQERLLGKHENKVVESYKKKLEEIKPESNFVLHNRSRDNKHYIFEDYSDTAPSRYVYVNSNDHKFLTIAAEHPHLELVKHSKMLSIEYPSEDGMSIPAFLTLPLSYSDKGDNRVPLIVFPHGGPWAHDEWGFDNYVQFFANRGYAVLQPQFRGSTGQGVRHLEAGYGQWGGAIQDDIRVGTEYVLKKYNIDRNRVCIVGASFGGYAAAMGLVQSPDLYKCGVSINGVLNLVKMIKDGSQLLHKHVNRKIWNDLREADEYSPYHKASLIQSPVLLIASQNDTVVPYQHSKKMYKRLKKLKSPVEYIQLEKGEHWRTYEPNEIAIFKAMDLFLSRHLNSP